MANSFSLTPASPSPVPVLDIETAALRPKRTRTEEGTVEERSMDELLKAQAYLDNQARPERSPWGIRVARGYPGSTTPGLRPLTAKFNQPYSW